MLFFSEPPHRVVVGDHLRQILDECHSDWRAGTDAGASPFLEARLQLSLGMAIRSVCNTKPGKILPEYRLKRSRYDLVAFLAESTLAFELKTPNETNRGRNPGLSAGTHGRLLKDMQKLARFVGPSPLRTMIAVLPEEFVEYLRSRTPIPLDLAESREISSHEIDQIEASSTRNVACEGGVWVPIRVGLIWKSVGYPRTMFAWSVTPPSEGRSASNDGALGENID